MGVKEIAHIFTVCVVVMSLINLNDRINPILNLYALLYLNQTLNITVANTESRGLLALHEVVSLKSCKQHDCKKKIVEGVVIDVLVC